MDSKEQMVPESFLVPPVLDVESLCKTALQHPVVCFFLTSPHDHPNRGDTDYVMSLIDGIKRTTQEICPIYITGDNTIRGERLYDYAAMYVGGAYKEQNSPLRLKAVENIISFIRCFTNQHKILHLQLRAPETGCMIHLSDIINLKQHVSRIFITCHEWTHGKDADRRLQLPYIKEADHTIFLNKADKESAAVAFQQAYLGAGLDEHKFSVSCVSSTVRPRAGLKPNSERPSNILIFGLIRENKGFEVAIQIAEKLAALGEHDPLRHVRIICAGKLQDPVLARILIEKATNEDYNNGLIKHASTRQDRAVESLKKEKFIEMVLDKLKLNPPVNENSIRTIIEKHFQSQGLKVTDSLAISLDILKADLDSIKKEAMRKKLSPAEKKEYDLASYMDFIKANDPNAAKKRLPIDFHFDVDANKLDELSAQCKYCIKFESKGFANNSSSIINALHRKLVIFTNKGLLTCEEFLPNGSYENALALFPDQAIPNGKGELEGQYINAIIDQIREREANADLNASTIAQAEAAVGNLFNINIICANLVKSYNNHLSKGVSR